MDKLELLNKMNNSSATTKSDMIVKNNKDCSFKIPYHDEIIKVLLGLVLLYIIYFQFVRCESFTQKQNLSDDEHYMFEQNMFKNLSLVKREEYLKMSPSDKKTAYANYYKN